MGGPRKYTDAQLIEAVALSRTVAQVLGRLGLRPAGGNYKTVQLRMEHLGVDHSHFLRQGWSRGMTIPKKPVIPLVEILVEGSHYQSHKLKKRLLTEGLKKPACEVCGLTRWNGLPIPLELEHVNGRSDDNGLGNLQLLCPNCHAQTATYRGKNIGRARGPRTPTGREKALKPSTV